MPNEAKPNAIKEAAGIARMAQKLGVRPKAVTTVRKPSEYTKPLIRAQVISPSAISSGPSGVESIVLYSLDSLSFQKTFQVES